MLAHPLSEQHRKPLPRIGARIGSDWSDTRPIRGLANPLPLVDVPIRGLTKPLPLVNVPLPLVDVPLPLVGPRIGPREPDRARFGRRLLLLLLLRGVLLLRQIAALLHPPLRLCLAPFQFAEVLVPKVSLTLILTRL